jgi:GNAT superfamily N-acetyltransferase/aminoglycoside phosphotransferase (APT) family kinase protein
MFKVDWEKTSVAYQLPEGMVEKMIRLAYPDKKLTSSELIAGGCANLNIKIQLKNQNQPLILRIYLRDQDAADREQKLAALIKETVPTPLTHYIGELEGHHFAITEFMPGISLRDLLLKCAPHDLSAIMSDVGMILSKIAAYDFPKSGFLNKEFEVVPYESSDIINFAQGCLNDKPVLSVLSPEVISGIQKAIEHNASLLPADDGKHLVHGDFDPANILVDEINGSWVVTGILDWEFAFSGSYLWDVANMLRYAHKMPPEFQNSFIDALQRNGIKLPPDWRTTAHLLNLSSLLDLLKRSDSKDHPHRCADIRELISHILGELNKMNERRKVQVRCYQDGDAKHIASIFYNTVHTVNAKDYTKEQLNAWAPYYDNYAVWQEKYAKLNPFVATIDGTIVGFAEFEPNGHIDCFYVHHEFQGAGVGTALMGEIEMEAREKLLPRIYAEVSITARPFFVSKGFQVIKQQTVGIRDIELTNFLMEKCFVTCELLSSDHIPLISDAFNQIGWNKPPSLFEEYLMEQDAGERLVWIAHVHNQFAGYVTLKWQSQYPSFNEQNIPEIMDLNVLPAYRKMGIGSLLLDTAEKAAATKSEVVGIGVGLYAGADGGYGAAQRLYVKRGYIPDGKGVTYNYQPAIPGNSYPLDDDLVLWFTKKLR